MSWTQIFSVKSIEKLSESFNNKRESTNNQHIRLKMPKVIYKQHFRDAWLQNPEFKDWIRKAMSETTKAYCSYCKCSVAAKLHDIKSHANTKKAHFNYRQFPTKKQTAILQTSAYKNIRAGSGIVTLRGGTHVNSPHWSPLPIVYTLVKRRGRTRFQPSSTR